MSDYPAPSALATMVGELGASGYVRKDPGVQFTSNENCYSLERHEMAQPITGYRDMTWELTLPEGVGYHGFIAVFYFDHAGALITHGCWE